MAKKPITLCWLDNSRQYRSRMIKRKIRPIPNELFKAKQWSLHYTHMITYHGRQIPAHQDAQDGHWWTFAA